MQQMSEEQRKQLEEKIKNMSPEELKEFQKQQCLFCQIIAGKVPARKVFENEKVIVVLDINPATPGHCLVIPKEHYAIMPQMPDGELQEYFKIVKGISQAILRGLQVEGTTVFIANGMAAGQKAQHFMTHVIPRMEKDGAGFEIPENQVNESDLQKVLGVLGGKATPKEVQQEAPEEEPKIEDKEELQEPEDKEESKDSEEKDEGGEADLDSIADLLSK